jgi:hypothetical protein
LFHLITLGRTSLDEGSACRRDLYLTTHNTRETDLYVHGGVRTRHLNNRATEDPRLRPRGRWDMVVQTLMLSDFSGAEILPTQRKDVSVICTKYEYLEREEKGWKFFMSDVVRYRYVIGAAILSFSFNMASNCQETYRLHSETAQKCKRDNRSADRDLNPGPSKYKAKTQRRHYIFCDVSYSFVHNLWHVLLHGRALT